MYLTTINFPNRNTQTEFKTTEMKIILIFYEIFLNNILQIFGEFKFSCEFPLQIDIMLFSGFVLL